MTRQTLDVLCVSGSRRSPSRTAALAGALAAALGEHGASCRIWDLAHRPVLGGAVARPDGGARAHDFAHAVGAADAVVLASPVYHNSCSGLLKSALDELGGELRRKPVALASCAASGRSPQALDHLRIVVRALGALVVPAQVVSSAVDHASDEPGHPLRNLAVIERVAVVTDELLWLAGLVVDDQPTLRARESRDARTLEPIP